MRLLLVDGHYYLYRSFFAIRGLSNSRGEPTNAIYGFVKALRRMAADVRPDFAAVVWDAGIPARRAELQPGYKQQRPPMPDDLRAQEGVMQKLVPMMGFAGIEVPNTEADDIIGAYAVQFPGDVVIATNDKDIMQLVSERVRIYSTNKTDLAAGGTFALLGAEAVRAKWGVEPAQIAEVLALTGDASDNIPGVPGIGGKTAAALVLQFGTVQSLLERSSEIASLKTREKIEAGRQQILDNREMVRLDTHHDLPQPVESLTIRPRYDELIAALRQCEFKGLLAEVEKEAASAAGGRSSAVQSELF